MLREGTEINKRLHWVLKISCNFFFHINRHNTNTQLWENKLWKEKKTARRGYNRERWILFFRMAEIWILYTMLCQAKSCPPLFETLWTIARQASLPWDFPGDNTGVVAVPSSRGSSQPKDQTHISCSSHIVGRFFTAEVTGEVKAMAKGKEIMMRWCLAGLQTNFPVVCWKQPSKAWGSPKAMSSLFSLPPHTLEILSGACAMWWRHHFR